MSEMQCLTTVFIDPTDEQKVLDAVNTRLRNLAGTGGVPTPPPGIELVDAGESVEGGSAVAGAGGTAGDAAGDADLAAQWSAEHPDEPAGDRRVRNLVAQVSADDAGAATAVAEVIIDVISPHARAEEEALQAGRSVQATPD